jgi:serine/threonine protein kinase
MKICPLCLTCFEDVYIECPSDGTTLEASHQGSTLIDGKYALECLLGKGGMGEVYQARHSVLGKHFALKLICPRTTDSASLEHKFRIEAKALGKLKHPNIVDVTDYGVDPRDPRLPYLVMEFLQGKTLEEHLQSHGPLSVGDFLPLLEQIAQAVEYAHQQGVLHCDLKPKNISLVQGDGGSRIAKVLDFGFARMVRPVLPGSGKAAGTVDPGVLTPPSEQFTPIDEVYRDVKQENASVDVDSNAQSHILDNLGKAEGTLAYMPPEVICGANPTETSDIYSLGVLIYQALVGKLPFAGSPLDIIEGHLRKAPITPSSRGTLLPLVIERILLSTLEKDPKRRPRSAVKMVKEMRAAYLRSERWQWLVREIPRRLFLAAILAIALGLLSLPLLNSERAKDLERRTVDVRFALQPRHAPDPRLLAITIDEASLNTERKLVSEMADEFGERLERVFAAGARSIAVDFLLPNSWNRSESFSRFVLKRSSRLTLGAFVSPSREIVGTNCLAGFTATALGPDRFHSLFGFVNLEEDSDGIIRRGRAYFADSNGERWDSWAIRAAHPVLDQTQRIAASSANREFFPIDYSADWRKIERLSWKDLPHYLEFESAVFRDRLVLVGGDYVASGDDYYRIPARVGSLQAVSGVMLEGLIVNTILADFPIRETRATTRFFAVVVLVAAVLAVVLCFPRLPFVAILFIGVNALYVLGAFLLFRWSNLVLPMGGPLLVGFVALGVSLALRSNLPVFPSSH